MKKNHKTYLVTGCAGFIGSHLCESLVVSGHKVYGIDNFDPFYSRQVKEGNISSLMQNPAFQLIEMDLSVAENYQRLPVEVDFVIHLAAKAGVRPSIQFPVDYVNHNVLATQLLLDWMQKVKINKFILGSSSSVYGNNKKIPFVETDSVDFPISNYAYTKKACELMTHAAHALHGIDSLCLRFFTVYGPRQRPDLAIHKFTASILNNKPITLYGDGTSARDYTYIDDIIQGITKAIDFLNQKTNVYEIVNIGSGNPVKLTELVNVLSETIGVKAEIHREPMQAGDMEITYADVSKAKTWFDYLPQADIFAGIQSFVHWYKANH